MPEMTISEASDLAGESATTFATMMSGDIDEQLAWFDEVYDSIMARLIRKALIKKIVADSSTDSPPESD